MNAPLIVKLPPPRRLDADSSGLRMSAKEFLAVKDWDPTFRYELFNGVVVVNAAASLQEGDPNEELGYLLRRYAEDHPKGIALYATCYERDVRIDETNVRRADRCVWLTREEDFEPDATPPDIAIEFVSPGRRNAVRDYIFKKMDYQKIGVREYWIIDRFKRTMTVHYLPPADLETRIVTEKESYSTPLLPGFKLPLKRILQKADRWAKKKKE